MESIKNIIPGTKKILARAIKGNTKYPEKILYQYTKLLIPNNKLPHNKPKNETLSFGSLIDGNIIGNNKYCSIYVPNK